MGQKEGGERAGHRLHNDRICGCRDRGKDGIHLRVRVVDGEHQRCVRRSSMPDTSLPHASPYRLRTITCLRSHYPPSRFGKARRAVEQESCPAAFQA